MNYAIPCALAIAALLSACASQQAYKVGQQRMAEQDWPAAMQAFEQAAKADPGNYEVLFALKMAREKTLDRLLSEGAQSMKNSPDKAEQAFRRVLLIDPANQRALEQLKAIERLNFQQNLYREATQAAATGRTQEAKAKFRRLLVEDASNEQARNGLRSLDEAQGRLSSVPTLNADLLKPVTISVNNGSIKMLFDALALSHKLNFVLDRDLKGDALTTVTLRNVPFDEALEQILGANGLDMRVVNPNTLLIYQATAQKYREHQELLVRNFFIESADVKELGNLLKTILKITDIHVDAKRNVLVVRDTPKNILAAEKLIAAHDQAEPEVMLDVEILEFNHSLSTMVGIQLPSQVSWGVASPITLNALNALTSSSVNVNGLSTLLQLNLQNQSAITKVLANPKIRIRNREKAKFHVGDRVPVITSTTFPGSLTGATSSSVSYLDVGIKLEFEPIIQLDGQVVIKTTLEDSSITDKVMNAGTTAYQLGTRNVSTTLTLQDGEMQILAGLIRSGEQNTTNQVPGLAEVPIFGRLFQNPSNSNSKKEILLSLTPRVIRNIHRPTDDLLQINTGPDSRSGQGARGATPAPTMGNQPPRPATAPGAPTSSPARSLLTPMVPFGQPPVQNLPAGAAPAGAGAGVAPPASGTSTSPAAPVGNLPVFQTPPGVGSSGG